MRARRRTMALTPELVARCWGEQRKESFSQSQRPCLHQRHSAVQVTSAPDCSSRRACWPEDISVSGRLGMLKNDWTDSG
jgi:hypothetical protein